MSSGGSSESLDEWVVFSTGIVLVLATLYLVWTVIGFSVFDWSYQKTNIRIGVGAAAATIALATGILAQGYLNSKRLEGDRKDRLINQESKWIPEVRQPLQANWLIFSGPRPWYPWFKVEINGESRGWFDVVVQRFPNEETKENREPQNWHEEMAWEVSDAGLDWYVPFPEPVRVFLGHGLENGDYRGELTLRFETLTGEEYFFIYHISVRVRDEGYRIFETPQVERLLPWHDSEKRDELSSELSEYL